MESKKIKEAVDSLLDDEAEIMVGVLALRKPQQLDPFAERARPFRGLHSTCLAQLKSS